MCKHMPLNTDLTTNAEHKHSLESIRIGFSLILAPNLELGRVVGTSIFKVFEPWAHLRTEMAYISPKRHFLQRFRTDIHGFP